MSEATAPQPRLARSNAMIVIAAGAAWLLTLIVIASQDEPAAVGFVLPAVGMIVLHSALVLVPWWLAALGLGGLLRRMLAPHLQHAWPLDAAVGAAAIMLTHWGLALAGMLSPAVTVTLLTAGSLVWLARVVLAERRRRVDARSIAPWPWTVVLWMPGVALLTVAASCPPGTLWAVEAFAYDVKSYHLQLPREWLAAGAMVPTPHNVYGYLPSLVEATFLHLASVGGGVRASTYLCQLWSASMLIVAAAAVSRAAAIFVAPAAAAVAGAVLLLLPWSLIVGSLAYNESTMLAMVAAAMIVLFEDRSERWRSNVLAGALLGAACMAKLSAAVLVGLPLVVVILLRLNHMLRWRPPPPWALGLRATAIVAGAAFVTMTPWMIRNAAWTGNPVFPFATGTLGAAHWSDELAQRWRRAHQPDHGLAEVGEAVARQWLFNAGYGAIGGRATPPETQNVARFPTEGGLPVLWGAAAAAAVAVALRHERRRLVLAMLLFTVLQLSAWAGATHLQSRFLIASALPACIVLACGAQMLHADIERRSWWMMPLAVTLLTLVLFTASLIALWTQTLRLGDARGGAAPAALWQIIDAAPQLTHPINDLPSDARVMLVADNTALLYIDRPIVYHTPFDSSPLGAMMRDGGDVARRLRDAGVTHLWIGWSELRRLHGTYGFDPDVTEPALHRLVADWRRIDANLPLWAVPSP